MADQATPAEVQAARAFLRAHGATSTDIPPREFANAAKEMRVGYRELFRTLANLHAGGTLGMPITSATRG